MGDTTSERVEDTTAGLQEEGKEERLCNGY